ncbi:DUF4249 domain-containing protein [Larkinella rosea]|uniref:DUF4249 domain-containing protein n=1 Tax=Larkinella rosea TaxID=2025312 RepID=A0A3P1BT17_9BACT|nr:DUF4249 domain-containing protein [Larkinella rosea]RRB04162.1 DUF4249 domain-containing protein [Larkinella rosea]
MRFLLFLLLAGLLVSLTACESLINEVDPDRLPTVERKLAVQCYISPQDSLLMATVTLSQPVLEPRNSAISSEIKVVLTEGNRSIELKYDPKQYAHVADSRLFPIVAGKTYRLAVQWRELSASASCTVPEAVPITSARLDSTRESNNWGGGSSRWIYDARLTWKDPVGQADYYRVAGELRANQWVTLSRYVAGQSRPDTFQRRLFMQSPLFFDATSQHISDLSQDGQSITSPKGNLPNYLSYTYFDSLSNGSYNGYIPLTQRPVSVSVMLLHVDKNYYDYHRTLQQQGDIEGNPFAEPVLIPTNITGGLGCFAAYNRTTMTISLN